MLGAGVELQDRAPEISLVIEKVGFKDVKRRIRLHTPEGEIALDVVLELYVEISGDRRGAHLSRNMEALGVLSGEGRSLEEYLEEVARKLLEKHSYARKVVTRAKTIYYVPVEFEGIRGIEPIHVEAEVQMKREEGRNWKVSVEVTGMTVCPSALEYAETTYGERVSHMQRVNLRARVVTGGEQVRIEKLAKALFASLSAPSISLLKRAEEAKLVREAFRRPKLLEDVVREAAKNVVEEVRLRGDAWLEVEAESYESIHPHNLYAYLSARAEDVKSILT
ncbi:MAG: GTP cyclohydrolase I FolE2 [Acidilobaceae archaeon]|nr:GTP cyclohydrolase I FolE2 [Acidilobaceae archaeon]MCX8165042.1 GTP cyclohydrolase I FolE2 [Acidilobaceae archaeon]MDW7974441.1 GTP cyclohydrolase I FolE2 [Sulfolobales archaeon]